MLPVIDTEEYINSMKIVDENTAQRIRPNILYRKILSYSYDCDGCRLPMYFDFVKSSGRLYVGDYLIPANTWIPMSMLVFNYIDKVNVNDVVETLTLKYDRVKFSDMVFDSIWKINDEFIARDGKIRREEVIKENNEY